MLSNTVVFLTDRGNSLLIGSIGTHLKSLAALALYMLEYPIHPVDCTYPNTFLDGLRSAVRQAGCDGKTTTVLFTVSILPVFIKFGLCGVIGNIITVWTVNTQLLLIEREDRTVFARGRGSTDRGQRDPY